MPTPPKSTISRRSKGSKHDLKFFIFPGPIFFWGGSGIQGLETGFQALEASIQLSEASIQLAEASIRLSEASMRLAYAKQFWFAPAAGLRKAVLVCACGWPMQSSFGLRLRLAYAKQFWFPLR